jgi:hypothetical protein
MVTPMTEQSGPSDPSERQGTDRQGTERQGTWQPGRGRSGADRSRQSPPPRPDLIGDLNRWLIRQGAKNVRKEIGGQVRRTFGGGRSATTDVWDTVTNEIPPVEGEAPECQWCPICRAARRMRDSGPGIGGQLSGAGEAVASAVQDAFNALDGLLSKTGGGNAQRDTEPRRTTPGGTAPGATAPGGTAPGGTASHGPMSQETAPRETGPQGGGLPETAGPESARQADADLSRGLDGWSSAADPWSTATEADAPGSAASDSRAADPAASTAEAGDAEAPYANSDPGTQHDRRGHEPDDRS